MSKASEYGTVAKLRLRPVLYAGCWKIEAALLVKGKWNVLLRQGEYDSQKEAEEALSEKFENAERVRQCAMKTTM